MYQEMTAVKDQVVVSLTNQVKYFSLHPGSFSCYTTIPRRGGNSGGYYAEGIYLALFTDPEGDSCFSIRQISGVKTKKSNFFVN